MSEAASRIRQFIYYWRSLKGDEKGEAQVFCDRLFRAFGHAGYKEAGATLEYRVKAKGRTTKYADLLWKPRLLMEMKSRGENLEDHFRQAFEYWLQLVPHRPRYVVLCNFDEFWIYDFDSQIEDPVDKVKVEALEDRYTALNFLFPEEKRPLFENNRVAVTRIAADKVARVFNTLIARKEDREKAQRFILQCVFAMFAEDFELLPKDLFTEILHDCRSQGNSYDLLGALFRQMSTQKPAAAGRYKDVPYFDGGLFRESVPIELRRDEVELLIEAASENWANVQPPIFGTLFQSSLDQKERHALGAHFTSEADIQKIVLPTIVRPWRRRIETTNSRADFARIMKDLHSYRVLDPACGCGNFLYVAYRELKRLEMDAIVAMQRTFSKKSRTELSQSLQVSTKQFFGIDINPFAAELAKVTLMLAKELSVAETRKRMGQSGIHFDQALPLDNLDDNIRCDDALFCKWPTANAIIGNPPYQSKNKMQQEFGRDYVNRMRAKYPDIPGRADYCVYWFRRAHDELPDGGRAGLVGTNTIHQTYSREGGLDYIVEHGGAITEAVATQVWSGDSAVHVSIVDWIKGKEKGKKKLFTQLGDKIDSPWKVEMLDVINSSLSSHADVTGAETLHCNAESSACYQGQTHGHAGFLLTPDEAREMMIDQTSASIIHPYLTGDELLSNVNGLPSRFAIDLNYCEDILSAMRHKAAFHHIEKNVMPYIKEKAAAERAESASENGPRQDHFRRWWKYWRGRIEMLSMIKQNQRYIACCRVTKRPIFEFISNSIHPNDALQVFPLPDDYSFGILQSAMHWTWFIERCSTLKGDFRYTSETVFNSFPWPQEPSVSQIRAVAKAAVVLRALRRKIMAENSWCLRDLYRTLDSSGENPLRNAHEALDDAARAAYGMKSNGDILAVLLDLNHEVAERESGGKPVQGPGLPSTARVPSEFTTQDCVHL
ncbi:MAG: DNA methyltransferase [bacterium]